MSRYSLPDELSEVGEEITERITQAVREAEDELPTDVEPRRIRRTIKSEADAEVRGRKGN